MLRSEASSQQRKVTDLKMLTVAVTACPRAERSRYLVLVLVVERAFCLR